MQEEGVRYLVVGGSAYERRKRVSVEGEALEIPVASREDLIAMKEGTGRLQDASDVKIPRPLAGGPAGGAVSMGGAHLNGDVLSWKGSPSLVTYQRSPAMTPTPVAVPV